MLPPNRLLTIAAALAGAAVLASLLPARVAGQAPRAAPAAKSAASAKGAVPRLPDGHPDLQGTYDLATLTPVERKAGSPLVLTDEEAVKLEREVAARKNFQAAPIKAETRYCFIDVAPLNPTEQRVCLLPCVPQPSQHSARRQWP